MLANNLPSPNVRERLVHEYPFYFGGIIESIFELESIFENGSSVENLALLIARVREDPRLVNALARFALQVREHREQMVLAALV